MAQQLHEAGEATAALVLLDTPLPLRPALSRVDKAMIKSQELRSKGVSYLVEWLRNRIAWEIAKRRPRPAESGQLPEFNNRKIELAFYEAIGAYQVRSWDGPMSLFRPPLDLHWQVSGGQWVNSQREYVFEDNDWRRWAPAVEVIEVPGDHDSMVLVPNVSVLAAQVKTTLDEADRSVLRAPMVEHEAA
jgi:thioesterase domain-containing protein